MSESPGAEARQVAAMRGNTMQIAWRESAWFAVLPILLPMVVTNFLICSAPLLLAIGLGFIPVQVALLTVLLVFGPGPFWQRWMWHWGLAVALYGSWSAGFCLWFRQDGVESIWDITFALPLFALVVQTPFWIARVLMGWRYVRRESGELPADSLPKIQPEQLTVRELLQGMAIIAVTLGVARFGIGNGTNTNPGMDWYGLLMGCTIAMVAAAFAILPILWVFSSRMKLESCWGVTVLYALVWITVLGFSVSGSPPSAATIALLVTCFAVVFAAGLSRLRLNGFQIERGRG